MAYKNLDHVREDRLYGYLNQLELDTFLEAMRLRDIGQQATAVRTFVIERSEQIIIDNRKQQSNQTIQPNQTVTYRLPHGNSTVMNNLTTLNLK